MNYSQPKVSTPMLTDDVDNPVNSKLTNKVPDLIPTVIIRSEGGGDSTKVKLLEKIIKTEVLLNVLLVLVMVVSLYISFVLRFDILNYFNKGSQKDNAQVTQSPTAKVNNDFNFRVVAAEEQPQNVDNSPQTYITSHGVNLDSAFQASSSGRLTIFGKLKNEVLGFLPYWAIPKLDQIDTRTVTSIAYFGLEVDGNGEIIKTDTNNRSIEAWTYLQKDTSLDNFFKKAKNSKIKIYITLKCFNQSNIIALTTSEQARSTFINNALYLMNLKSFDGVNIDFEYIGTPDKKVRDGFSALMIELYKTMKDQNADSKLTIDTFVDAASATRIHDIPVLAQNSDGLVIMGYDFHTPNSSLPGPVSPMEGSGLSIKGLMTSYLEKAPAAKLILAVPYYGYDWPVAKSGDMYSVVGTKQGVNIVAYGELAGVIKNTQISWDENAAEPWYTYTDPTGQSRLVYFENVRSLSIKYDYVIQKKLQGVAIWALGFDGKRTELNQTLVDKFSE